VSKVRSHFGARRFADNWALGQVKADMDAKKADPAHESVRWDLYSLRKCFNAEKATVAPWWRENSKEVYLMPTGSLGGPRLGWKEEP